MQKLILIKTYFLKENFCLCAHLMAKVDSSTFLHCILVSKQNIKKFYWFKKQDYYNQLLHRRKVKRKPNSANKLPLLFR